MERIHLKRRRRRRQSSQVKARTAPHQKTLLLAMLWFFTSLIFLSYTAFSFDSTRLNNLEYLQTLEQRVWSCSDRELSDLEVEVTENIQVSSHSSFMHYLLGQLYIRRFMLNPYEMHQLRQAAELGQQAIDLRPNKDFGYVIAAQVLDMMGYTDNALNLIEPASNPKIIDSWRTLFLKGKIKAGNNFRNSLNTYKSALNASYSQPSVILPHAIALIESHLEGEQRVQELRTWLRISNDANLIRLSLAIALTDIGKYSEAYQVYQIIPGDDTHFNEALINKSILQYNYLNQRKNARFALEKLRQSKKFASIGSEKQTLVLGHLANIHLREKQYQKAEHYFMQALLNSKTPLEWIPFVYESYKKNYNFKELSQLIERLKIEIPGTGGIYALHGSILSEHLNSHQEAILAYEDAILLEPNRSEFYNGLGLAYYRKNNMDKALNIFVQATQIDPNDATARYNEACVLSLLGRSNEALGSLKEAINLDPTLSSAAANDQDFANIRASTIFAEIVKPTISNDTLVKQQELEPKNFHINVRYQN